MDAPTSIEPSAIESAAIEPASLERAGASGGRLLLLLGLVAGWGWITHRFGLGRAVYTTLGPFGVVVAMVIVASYRHALGRWFSATRRALVVGVGVGVGMTLLTYPAYALMLAVAPGLGQSVEALYSAAREAPLGLALPWMLVVILAEELLWRGAWLELLRGRGVSPALAMALSIATYAAAQLGTGSWIVASLALACGTIWTLSRLLTGSLLSPLIAHLIWTPIVILLYPVTALYP